MSLGLGILMVLGAFVVGAAVHFSSKPCDECSGCDNSGESFGSQCKNKNDSEVKP